jgi:hypothetical protein
MFVAVKCPIVGRHTMESTFFTGSNISDLIRAQRIHAKDMENNVVRPDLA